MSQFLPDLGALLAENKDDLEEWDPSDTYLFRTLSERKKLNSYLSVFLVSVQGQASVNWLKTIAENDHPNRALLWYTLGLSCLYAGDYGEASQYFTQCCDIIEAGRDDLLTDSTIWHFFSAREAARACEANDDCDTALNWCNKALEILKSPEIIDGETTQDESHVREMQGPIYGIIEAIREKNK